jgi:hypothetical protein
MNISTTDAQGLYTKEIVDRYKERTAPQSFLRSFFPTVVTPTLEVSIEVQRGTEKIAVDVERSSDGTRNQFTRSTEKIFIPPYFKEYFDATQLQLYDRLYGASQINDAVFAAYINSVLDAAMDCRAKIERAYELQCSQVLETGIVTTSNGNIDFKRKAASKVVKTGAYWTTGSVSPYTDLENGAIFLRQKGKAMGGTFNAIFGSTAWATLLQNTTFLTANNLFNLRLDSVSKPQRDSLGGTLHGQLVCGSYLVNCWTYNDYYDDSTGASTPYVNPKVVIMLPEAPRFKMAFAAVPQLITPNSMPQTGAFILSEYLDERRKSRDIVTESCGLAIPVAVDQIYTVQVVA